MEYSSPIAMKNPALEALLESLPIDASVRIELVEGIPIFRAPPHVRARIEELLDQRETAALNADERQELIRYEELDEFLALVNRLVRNEALGEGLSRVSAA